MADEKKSKEKDQAPAEVIENKPASQRNPLVLALLVFNIIALGAVAFMQYTAMKREAQRSTVVDLVSASNKKEVKKEGEGGGHGEGAKNGENKGEETRPNGFLFPLDAFTANLAQGDGPRRYLRTSMVLRFSDDSKEGEFKSRSPQIRDTIISILNSKRPEDLLKKEGKSYLKEEIKSSINAFLVDGRVIDVFYVSFQIN